MPAGAAADGRGPRRVLSSDRTATRTSPSRPVSAHSCNQIRAHSRLAPSLVAIARAERAVAVPAARWITTVSPASSSSAVPRPSAATTPTPRPTFKNTRFYATKAAVPEIKVGEKIPKDITVRHIDVAENEDVCQGLAAGKHATMTTDDLFKGKKVVVISVPGPYTPVSWTKARMLADADHCYRSTKFAFFDCCLDKLDLIGTQTVS
jgi:hypothetical protein